MEACTGCGACVEACPTAIIGLADARPSLQGERLPQSSAVDDLDHYIKAAHAGMSMGAVSLD